MSGPSAPDADTVHEAAALLADAWNRRQLRPALPAELRPPDLATAYAIQARVALLTGPVGGWKCGAGSPVAVPGGSSIPRSHLWPAGATVPLNRQRGRIGVEIEICLRVGRDLPPRDHPFSLDEILDVVAGILPALEIVDSRYDCWPDLERQDLDWPSQVADLQNTAGLVLGPERTDWRSFDFSAMRAVLSDNGTVLADRINGNTAGFPLRTLPWLLTDGPARSTGLRAGDYVTTGSCNGLHFVTAGSEVSGSIDGLGTVSALIGTG
jgi:2-keto-4-pentenoate hydratase